MSEILIFGHKNPDTDSICSALVMEKFNQNNHCDCEAVRLGKVNKETQFVLDYLGIEAPRLIERLADSQSVILVDHNEFMQSAENIEHANIEMVVDHHRICNFETAEPLYYLAEPVGCTATILCKKFQQADMKIEKKEATLMLSAIISDTLLFKSPTCTKYDIAAAERLAKIAEIDVATYGMELLKAGTDLSDVTAEELITLDAKEVMLGDMTAVIAQVNTADITEMMERKTEIEAAMQEMIVEKNLDIFVFGITDIVNSNTQAIVLGEKADIVEKAYGVTLVDHSALLKGVVSRKKQIIPILTKLA